MDPSRDLLPDPVYWPLVLGGIIVVLVLAFPQGIVGFAQSKLAGRARA